MIFSGYWNRSEKSYSLTVAVLLWCHAGMPFEISVEERHIVESQRKGNLLDRKFRWFQLCFNVHHNNGGYYFERRLSCFLFYGRTKMGNGNTQMFRIKSNAPLFRIIRHDQFDKLTAHHFTAWMQCAFPLAVILIQFGRTLHKNSENGFNDLLILQRTRQWISMDQRFEDILI